MLSPEEQDLLSGLDEAGTELEAIRDQEQPLSGDFASGYQNPVTEAATALATGGWKSLFETKDAVLGETPFAERSDFRKTVERQDRQLGNQSAVNSITSDISQFATGMIGAGKLVKPLKIGQMGKKAQTVAEITKAAGVGSVVFDPHEERLSNLLQQYPTLQNPVSEYLAADIGDGEAEGRFKAAVESIGLDVGISVAFAASLRLLKLGRTGAKPEEISKAADEVAKIEFGSSSPTPLKPTTQTVGVGEAPAPEMNPFASGWKATSGDVPPTPPPGGPTQLNPEAAGLRPNSVTDATPAPQPGVQLNQNASGWKPKDPNEVPVSTELPSDGLGTGPNTGGTTPNVKVTSGPRPVNGELGDLQKMIAKGEAPPAPAAKAPPTEGITQTAPVNPAPPPKKVPQPLKDENIEGLLKEDFDKTSLGSPRWVSMDDIADVPALRDLQTRLAKAALTVADNATGRTFISDATLERQARSMAVAFNESPDDVMAMIRRAGDAGNEMAANLVAAERIQQSFARDISNLATKMKYGLVPDMQEAANELRRRMTLLADAVRMTKDIAGGAGRTLRRKRSDFAVTEAQLKAWEKVDDQSLVDMLYNANGELGKVKESLRPSFWKKVGGVVDHHLVNGPLWWFPTHVWNGISNFLMVGLRPLPVIVGSVFTPGAGAAVRRQAMREYRYMAASTVDAFSAAVSAFMRGDSILTPHQSYFNEGGQTSAAAISRDMMIPVNSHLDVVRNAMRLYMVATGMPTRLLGGQDEFFKTIVYRGVVQAKAAEEAMAMGLKGAEMENHIKSALDGAYDELGQATDIAAIREAQKATFTQPLTGVPTNFGADQTAGALTNNFINGLPGGRAILPFIRTPINAFRHSFQYTPGLNLLQAEYRAMLGSADPAVRARAWGQMAIGSSVVALSGMLAAEGRITGAGPRDPDAKRHLLSMGWRPYSFIYEKEDGSKVYVPLNRLDPLSLPLGMAADVMDLAQHPEKRKDAESLAGAVMISLMHNVTDKTFLISVNSAIRAIMEPEKNLAKFAGNAVEQAVPFSSLLRNVNSDPYMKEARGLVDNALDRMPGYSKNVPNKYSPLGDPMIVKNGIWSETKHDALDEEIVRLSETTGLGLTPPTPTRHNVDFRDFELEDGSNAYEALQKLSGDLGKGDTLREKLTKLIESDAYKAAVDGESATKGTRLNMITATITKYREAALAKLLSQNKNLRDALAQRRKEVGAQVRENRRQQQLNALGVQ
ncbi:hypothetical protein [Aestuariivirga sp.]|uniref:hypothetical protein n=1 Tax=Aestuariivirga sp. TaxID=2650926 RepID=UPI0039E488FA